MYKRLLIGLKVSIIAMLLVGPLCITTVESKVKPSVIAAIKKRGEKFFKIIDKLKKSGIVRVSHSKATYRGKVRCDSKYKSTDKLSKAFLHVYNLTCWSCPKGYKRSLDPNVAGKNACVRPASSSWAKIIYKGKGKKKLIVGLKCPKGSFRHRLTSKCYACPKGYKRTVFDLKGKKACEKVNKASYKKATKRGKPGCDRGFQHGLTNKCYSCPKGYKRSLVICNDPSKHRKACERIKVNPPKKAKEFITKAQNDFKNKIWKKHRGTFNKALSLMKGLNPAYAGQIFVGNKKTKERILRDIIKKTKITKVLSPLFQKNVFGSGNKADGESCKDSFECRSGASCFYGKCVYSDMRTFTISGAMDFNFFLSIEVAMTMGIRVGDAPNGSSKVQFYGEMYIGGGYTKGADAALDFGVFNATNDNLGGDLMGVTFAMSGAVGNSMGVTSPAGGAAFSIWLTCPGKTACFFGKSNPVYIAGIQFGPQWGKSIEAEFGVVYSSKMSGKSW
jgi:hypothetical protein